MLNIEANSEIFLELTKLPLSKRILDLSELKVTNKGETPNMAHFLRCPLEITVFIYGLFYGVNAK
jgi:hypothetical protein